VHDTVDPCLAHDEPLCGGLAPLVADASVEVRQDDPGATAFTPSPKSRASNPTQTLTGDTAVQLQIKLLDPAIHGTQRPYRARAGPPWQWPAAALPLASRAMK
jgi:hypothetical protein